jgi:hypothetical protein
MIKLACSLMCNVPILPAYQLDLTDKIPARHPRADQPATYVLGFRSLLDPSVSLDMGAERRTSEREFPRRTTAVVAFERCHLEFQILDESAGGLGIFAPDRQPFNTGKVFPVSVGDDPPRDAEVRYIASLAHGGFHVGLRWSEPAGDPNEDVVAEQAR